MNIYTIASIASGGALGALSRFYVGNIVVKYFPHEVPLATLTVNLVGSFIIGVLIGLFINHTPPATLKFFLVTGFLGAFTTYSTFAIESFMLLSNNFWYGILNISLNLVGTIVLAGIGYKIISI